MQDSEARALDDHYRKLLLKVVPEDKKDELEAIEAQEPESWRHQARGCYVDPCVSNRKIVTNRNKHNRKKSGD